LLGFEAEIERGDRPSQGKSRTEDRRGGETCGILIRVNNYWGFGVVREAWRRSDTHTEIGKHGGCGLFLYSRRRQKEGAEGRETNNGKGGGGRSGGQIRAGEDKPTPNSRPKTRPKLYAEREKGSLPGRRRSHLVLCCAVFSFLCCYIHLCCHIGIPSPCPRQVGRAATKVRIM